MATFLINTKTELWKCRRTAAYWITIAGSVFIPLVIMTTYIARPDQFAPRFEHDGWLKHINNTWKSAAAFLLPMFVIMVSSLVVQIEYRNNTWKQVYASPRSLADIFFSKFVIIHLLIISCFVLFALFTLVAAYIANLAHARYPFLSTPVPWKSLLMLISKQYIAILAMTSFQYWLSLRIRNYIAPMGIGLALLITGLIILDWEKIIYYPYAYTAVTFFRDKGSNGIANHEIYSLVWFVVILALAFWDTVYRKEKG